MNKEKINNNILILTFQLKFSLKINRHTTLNDTNISKNNRSYEFPSTFVKTISKG
jgi:hypothetical protein